MKKSAVAATAFLLFVWAGLSFRRHTSWAFNATTIVDTDIRTAPQNLFLNMAVLCPACYPWLWTAAVTASRTAASEWGPVTLRREVPLATSSPAADVTPSSAETAFSTLWTQ
ncbi:UNVERIFIED_ORG: hypothetical protein ABID57_002401 [Arthrobacter sp. UYEF1]